MKLRYIIIVAGLLLVVILPYGCAIQTDSPNQIKDIDVQESFDLIQRNQGNPDFMIIDVRTPEEFAEGHIENAINIDFYSQTFEEELDRLDRGKAYFIYCRSGNRSGQAREIMKAMGFTEVYNLSAGIVDWISAGLPVVK